MGKLLMDDQPLVVSPRLAQALGSLDQAVILQQLHYWLKKSKNFHDGRPWVYNSMEAWMKQFPWIKSRTTLTKHFNKLKKIGLVVTSNYNKAGFDKTTWYSIDYRKLQLFSDEFEKSLSTAENDCEQSIDQNLYNECTEVEQRIDQKLNNGLTRNCTTNTRDYPEINQETTTENNKSDSTSDKNIPFKEIIEYLNEKTDNSYKPSAEGHKKLIRARWKEKNTLDDFKMVIDYKASEWMGNKMEGYLRPKTLFAAGNFDNYLSEAKKKLKRDGQDNSLFANQWHPQNDDDLPF